MQRDPGGPDHVNRAQYGDSGVADTDHCFLPDADAQRAGVAVTEPDGAYPDRHHDAGADVLPGDNGPVPGRGRASPRGLIVFWGRSKLKNAQGGQDPSFIRSWIAITLVIGLFFFSSVQLFFIGIIGEYIGAIHTQVQKRPLVIEKERINLPPLVSPSGSSAAAETSSRNT